MVCPSSHPGRVVQKIEAVSVTQGNREVQASPVPILKASMESTLEISALNGSI